MSEHSQTTANKPTEPRLCKMGCGFFGNGATDDCCSKCWRELQKKNVPAAPPTVCKPVEPEAPQPMEVETEVEAPEPMKETAVAAAPLVASTLPKKKKKKASYKNMMASMMHTNPVRDVEKEKESLRNVTGGGAFSKIDKI